jgi:hypothetical protein
LIGAEVRDSCGNSGTGETHAGVYAEEAHRPPRGKRASGVEINHTALLGNWQQSLRKQPLLFKQLIGIKITLQYKITKLKRRWDKCQTVMIINLEK